MKRLIGRTMIAVLALAAGASGLFWNGEFSSNRNVSLVSEAQAIIGRPLTPVSYAGVARRTVRRCAAGVYC